MFLKILKVMASLAVVTVLEGRIKARVGAFPVALLKVRLHAVVHGLHGLSNVLDRVLIGLLGKGSRRGRVCKDAGPCLTNGTHGREMAQHAPDYDWVNIVVALCCDFINGRARVRDTLHGLEQLDFCSHPQDIEMGRLGPQQIEHGLRGVADLCNEASARIQQLFARAGAAIAEVVAQSGDIVEERQGSL